MQGISLVFSIYGVHSVHCCMIKLLEYNSNLIRLEKSKETFLETEGNQFRKRPVWNHVMNFYNLYITTIKVSQFLIYYSSILEKILNKLFNM